MKKDQEIMNKYPLLYADKDKSVSESLVCFGFECGEGWYGILDKLSEKLEKLIINFPECKALQVKEKFGGLRFYMTSSTDEMEKLIESAEEECWKTCEICGKPATHTTEGWIRRVCDKHIK